MQLHKLLDALSSFDPETEVKVLTVHTDWAWDGENSIPYDNADWDTHFSITFADDIIKIGTDDRM